MSATNRESGDRLLSADSLTRRNLFRAGGAAGLTFAAGGFLSACGGGGSSTGSSAGGSGVGIQPGLGKELADVLGVTAEDVKLAGKQTWRLGVALPLSGQGALEGVRQSRGVELARKHIALAGGPKIKYDERDHKSGDAASGALIARTFGANKIGAQITSYIGILGSEVPGIGQYKIMTFDPGGSVGAFTSKPYFWAGRILTPQDLMGGAFGWLGQAHPDMKRVAFVFPDFGDVSVKGFHTYLSAAIKAGGQQVVAESKYKFGTTDFSSTIRALQAAPKFDMVFLVGYGRDPGYFLKQYKSAGLTAQVMTTDLGSDARKIAGDAYKNLWVALEYFDFNAPPNRLSKIFVDAYRKAYGEPTADNVVTANYYESTLNMWALARRVMRKGGDPNSGEALQAALTSEPTLPSVYGGSSTELGAMSWDTQTHQLDARPMSMLKITDPDGPPEIAATYGIGGKDLKVIKS